MKTLTLHQPWASLIAYGVKTIETRSWAPPQGLAGQRIAIHAGKRVERDSLNFGTCKAIEKIYGPEWWRDIPVGVVLCTAVLTEAWRVVSFSGGYFQTQVLRARRRGSKSKDRPLWRLRLGPMAVVPPRRHSVQLAHHRGGPEGAVGLVSMTPYWENGVTRLYQADARALPLPDESVHCVVTSPPYWGLRDYKLEPQVWGGSSGCAHTWDRELLETEVGGGRSVLGHPRGDDPGVHSGPRREPRPDQAAVHQPLETDPHPSVHTGPDAAGTAPARLCGVPAGNQHG